MVLTEKKAKMQLRKNVLESETNRTFQIFMTTFIIGFTLITFTVSFAAERGVPTAPFTYSKDNLSLVVMLFAMVFTFVFSFYQLARYKSLKRKVHEFVREHDPDFDFLEKK